MSHDASAIAASRNSCAADVRPTFRHELHFVEDAFEPSCDALRKACARGDEPVRVATFIDAGLAAARPELIERLEAYLARHRAALEPCGSAQLVPGGEACKNDPSELERIWGAMRDARLCRRSVALVIGGGAVLDLVGFAAATLHRGVRLVRLPSTTLGQADSGVGVKNGVNRYGQKNYLGTYAVPDAVINDAALLTSLSDRDWRAGFSEAVKVAVLKDRAFFERLERNAPAIGNRESQPALTAIELSARLHFEHIVAGGDPFERGASRPLDFGHWSAHRLESLTGFELRHGEAVAIGVALDAQYAAEAGIMAQDAATRVHACLRALGLPTWHERLTDMDAMWIGLEQFREHLGGRLTLAMATGIGAAGEVNQVDRRSLESAARRLCEAEAY